MGILAMLDGASNRALLISAGVILFGVLVIVSNMLHMQGSPAKAVAGLLFPIGVIGYWVFRLNWHRWGGTLSEIGLAIAVIFVVCIAGWSKIAS